VSLDQLTALAARLRDVPQLGNEIAKEAAPSLLSLNKASAAAGTTPMGEQWAPTKQGKRALVHAADAITASVVGDVIFLVLSGINVFHNRRRRIVPSKGTALPPGYRDAIFAAARRVIERAA